MKRNISVFILLILLASSFKYRTKAKETDQQVIKAGFTSSNFLQKEDSITSFDGAVARLQEANQKFIKGNPEPLMSLWAHSDEVTVFDGIANQELNGWKSIESNLSNASMAKGTYSDYSSKKIASHDDDDQAYLLQEEYYRQPGGKTLNLHVTVLFRKENSQWKIVHRHEDVLDSNPKSDKSSK